MERKEIKRLTKAYRKSFALTQKQLFTSKDAGLLLFVNYLRYLRDFGILNASSNEVDINKNQQVATLISAIAEFDVYRFLEDPVRKTFHWNNFCELVKQNMEDWLQINDSVKENNCA